MRILVADDQTGVLDAARFLLKSEGHSAVTVDNPQAVMRLTASDEFDLILMDLNYARDTTSGTEGLDLLRSLRSAGVNSPVVVMTAWGNVDLAVEAMRRGAADFVQKPWDNARLLETIEKQVQRARASRSDLDIARNIQRKLLPASRPKIEGLAYAARCVPVEAVGGDYYDWFADGPDQFSFVLADVSGKGIAAALLMAHLHGAFRTRHSMGPASEPGLLEGVNRQFHHASPPEQYATLFFGWYDAGQCRLRYVNAGHPPALVIRKNGEVERLHATTTVVGLFADWKSTAAEISLQPGDNVLVYSDGVSEAGSGTGVEFGEERLITAARNWARCSPEELVERLCARVAAYDAAQHDDYTLLALKCGNSEG